ncbi:MAG: hypothetical protein K2I42_05220 [Anaeroplasmataceae bacterium]|nr:hypothetical protein [Anaeroplasmataceae bacterium]
MMNLEIILSFMGTALGFLVSLLTLIIKLSKNKKVTKTIEQMLSITDQLNTFIIEAEQFKNYTGTEKKNYVLTKINQFAIDNKIKFSLDSVSDKIEEIISLTKNVNCSNSYRKDWLE